MSTMKKALFLLVAFVGCLAVLGLMFYLYVVVKDYRITLAITILLAGALLIFKRLDKRKSKY
ncbi:hypothetical protein [Enterococcus rivorum]|uniref:Uncharacterized protein n=1 Tax=Enterococcus rivorum TaxID=762845 RepID=A0A1E5L0C4_9ENTE|nr:hypothetical protein [Enterococcus rivorum]MBP2098800.1 hypothetical protein [Enterococcus rivorum]OEH83535.1 hypothetical protein BCR26_08625 [Enterococcus rivorum]